MPLSRRELLGALPAGLILATKDATAGPKENPILLLIVVDTLRADALGSYGEPQGLSPFLDALGRRGRVYEHHVASSSWTRSSMASIFSGLDPDRHGLLEVEARLSPGLPTLAERLRGAGFRTAAFVANPIAATPDLMRGFDRVVAPGATPPRAEVVVERAADWILQHPDEPLFALLHLFDPHAPYDPPAEHRHRYCPGCPEALAPSPKREYPAGPPPAAQVSRWRALYAGEVRAVDQALERLNDALRPLSPRLRWLVTADHGEAFGEHGVFEHAFHLWQEVLHVPMILAGPGISPGRVRVPTGHVDLAPTLLQLAGLGGGGGLLYPAADRVLRSEVRMYGVHRLALRQGPLKLTVHAPLDEATFARYHNDPGIYPSVVRGTPVMYAANLEEDPGERRDALEDQAPAFQGLLDAARAWLDGPAPAAGMDPALAESLRALGYLD